MSNEAEYVVGHCPICQSQRADIKVRHTDRFDEGSYSAITHYDVLECRGCGEHYFKSSSSNSEDCDYLQDPDTGEYEQVYPETIHFWPPAGDRQPPGWAVEIGYRDRVLGGLFDDVYTALRNNLGVLAAIGMRTVFDRASELLQVDSALPFADKLRVLKDSDHITGNEQRALGVLVDAGSAAVHRGWRPNPRHLDQMMVILESFLHRAFVLEDVGAELENQVPKRAARKPKK